ICLIMAMCLLLSACALSDRMRQLAASFGQTQEVVRSHHTRFSQSVSDLQVRRSAQEVDRPWLAGRSQPLAREVTLPLALRANVHTTLLFADGEMDLPTLAQRITAATKIPVQVRPDALLPMDHFLPRLGTSGM